MGMPLFPKSYIGLDFHDYSAQLVELKMKNDVVSLEAYNRMIVPPNVIRNGEILQEDELRSLLVDLFKKANPKEVEPKNVAVVFPSSKVLTHIFSFPAALEEKELEKALRYEVEKVIPFSLDDVYFDFAVLRKEHVGMKHATQYILFAAVIKATADQYTKLLESVGVVPTMFGIQSEALRYVVPEVAVKQGNSLIIDVGTLSVNYLLLENGVVKHYFSSNEGGFKLFSKLSRDLQVNEGSLVDKKEKNNFDKVPELEGMKDFILKNYERGRKMVADMIAEKKINSLERVYLTGEYVNLPDFFDLAKSYFPNQEVFLADPKKVLDINPGKFVFGQDGQDNASIYSIYFVNPIGAAVGALKSTAANSINLLPDKLRESLVNKKMALIAAIAAILMTAIALFGATFMFFQYQILSFERLSLQSQKSAIDKLLYGNRYQEITAEIAAFNNEVSALTAIDKQLFSVPTYLERIREKLPQGVSLSSYSFKDEDLAVQLAGVADTRENLLELQANLEATDFIEEVVFPISNFNEKKDISFSLEVKLDFTKLDQYGASASAE